MANASNILLTLLGSVAGFTNVAVATVREYGADSLAGILSRDSVRVAMTSAIKKHLEARATRPIDYAKLQAADDELRVACITYDLASPHSNPVPVAP